MEECLLNGKVKVTIEKKDELFLENDLCSEASTDGVVGPGVEVRDDVNAATCDSYNQNKQL